MSGAPVEKNIVLPMTDALALLEVLRLTPIYALMGSEFENELGNDFKRHKWEGYEKDHAERCMALHAKVLAAAQAA
jgi:hypothetical protein